jgi:hypothetical protein
MNNIFASGSIEVALSQANVKVAAISQDLGSTNSPRVILDDSACPVMANIKHKAKLLASKYKVPPLGQPRKC